jgi:hypothetical protein
MRRGRRSNGEAQPSPPEGATAEERARLGELIEAISHELASGRPVAAVARGLETLGLDRRSARRMVAQVAAQTGAVPPRRSVFPGEPFGHRLALGIGLAATGLLVGYACLDARQHGVALYLAGLSVIAGAGECLAALRARARAQ